jgi:hypothetical protein
MCWLLYWLLQWPWTSFIGDARLITDIVLCRVRNCFLVFCKGTTKPSVHPQECFLLIIICMGDKYHSSSLSLCAILRLQSSSLAAVFCLVRNVSTLPYSLNNYVNVIRSVTSIDKKADIYNKTYTFVYNWFNSHLWDILVVSFSFIMFII